jgi:lysophospholipase L1-like esterase
VAEVGRLLALPLAPLLLWQGRRVRRDTPTLAEAEGDRDGWMMPARGGQAAPIRLLLLGDSSAAGVGTAHQGEALGGQLLARLAPTLKRPLRWRLVARTGLRTREARGLLQAVPHEPWDVVLVALGVNDVTALQSRRSWAREVADLAGYLVQAHGVRQVIWSGLPPMHRFPALPQPLRAVLGAHARTLDRVLQGHRAVQHLPMPEMRAPGLVASDGFHPGPGACALWAQAALHPVLSAFSACGPGPEQEIGRA